MHVDSIRSTSIIRRGVLAMEYETYVFGAEALYYNGNVVLSDNHSEVFEDSEKILYKEITKIDYTKGEIKVRAGKLHTLSKDSKEYKISQVYLTLLKRTKKHCESFHRNSPYADVHFALVTRQWETNDRSTFTLRTSLFLGNEIHILNYLLKRNEYLIHYKKLLPEQAEHLDLYKNHEIINLSPLLPEQIKLFFYV